MIKCICGLLRFEGAITINGYDNRSKEAKQQLGYIPEMPALYPNADRTGTYGIYCPRLQLKDWKPQASQLLRRFELDDKQNKLGKELSKGMQQKVSICCAALTNPRAVIFDEPLVAGPPCDQGIEELDRRIEEGWVCYDRFDSHDRKRRRKLGYHLYHDRRTYHRACRREDLDSGSDLEDLYFSITEGSGEEKA